MLKRIRLRLFANIFSLLLLIGFWVLPSAAQDSGLLGPQTSTLPTLQAAKSCMSGSAAAECLDQLIREALKTHSVKEVLQLVERYEAEDPEFRRDCHPVVHAIGRETFRLKGNIHEAFAACDQTCHSGCYHGSVERFLRGDSIYAAVDRHPSIAELKQKAASACDPNIALRFRFQCLHGLGHALMFFSRYNLNQSLEICDALSDDWNRNSCYGGVFMENVSSATPESRDLSPTDYHYPCSKIAAPYKGECYAMQTSRMAEMGLTTEQILKECDRASEFRIPCLLSAGRDLSNDVRFGDGRAAAQKCELVDGTGRAACMRGVVYALIDNTWDGRYALPFCTAFNQQDDRNGCFTTSAEYLKSTFEKSSTDVRNECTKHLKQPAPCVEVAAR
jgi:hypothetical protein